MLGYLEDSGYPQYDPEAAQAEFDQCLAELGTDTIEFTFNTTNDPFNVESNTLIISMWHDVFGDQVQATITPIEQGQYIGLALDGTFKAFGWRNHGGIDPATQAVLVAEHVVGADRLAGANFGRFKDPEIDEAFDTIKRRPRPGDPQGRRRGRQQAFRRAGLQPLAHLGALGDHRAAVRERRSAQHTPRRRRGRRPGLLGRHQMNQIWCDEGVCE